MPKNPYNKLNRGDIMKRLIMEELRKWKNSKYRKPLILKGARQVGKTWIMKEFSKEFKNVVYINFDGPNEYQQFFETTKDVYRIMENISFSSGIPITKETLIIFDEIQNCNEALNSLKYFCEDAKDYYVIAAGSLLGLSLSKGFPVGKVDFLDVHPMNFLEFLLANGDDTLFNYLLNIHEIEEIPSLFFNKLIEKLKMYLIIGGMPEPISYWVKEKDIELVDHALNNILKAYTLDFGKHFISNNLEEKYHEKKINLVWNSLPSELAKENKKFLYSVIKTGARAREYEDALEWLIDADLVKKVFRVSKPYLPLKAYQDLNAFKVYHLDVGLLRKMSSLSYKAFSEGNRIFSEFKGALSENFILESLSSYLENSISYWDEAPYEVDFLIQIDNDIFPIEVKSGTNVHSLSLKKYQEKYNKETKLLIRFSLLNLTLDGNILNVPLFMVDLLPKLIKIALNKLEKDN